MDTTIVTALAGIVGSLCGGSASVATAWVTQKTRNKRERIRAEVKKREALYGEFINECSQRVMDSLARNLDKPETLLSIYVLLNRIRLCASEAVLAQAQEIVRFIMEQYLAPNVSVEELHERVHNDGIDPLKAFSEACRRERLPAKTFSRLSKMLLSLSGVHLDVYSGNDSVSHTAIPSQKAGWSWALNVPRSAT